MLQPEQLSHVSETCVREVDELHKFFCSTGIQTGSAASLPAVADRIATDHAFRRDLRSHVWVILDAHSPEISYADLLGALALAAAGPAFATAARDSDAHSLLRFLMEARRSLENTPVPTDDLPGDEAKVFAIPPGEMQLRHATGRATLERNIADVRRHLARQVRRRSRRAVLILSVLCLAAAIMATVRWRGRAAVIPDSTTLAAAAPLPEAHVPVTIAATRSSADRTMQTPRAAVSALRHGLPAYPATVATASLREPEPFSHAASAATTAGPAPVSPTGASAVGGGETSAPASRLGMAAVPAGRSVGIPAATPTAVLSQQLGARTLSPDYALEDRSYNARFPRLRRRRPLLPLAEERGDTAEQVASNEPPALFRAARDSTAGAAGMVVRPVSLGTMAANVLYSPAPAYPPAAAAAHVQGEVKVQAEVDRDGNVAFARVISGPALLRDAAVDAVQRWRYRPYLSAGRPVAMSATAVLEFQLQ